MQEEWRIFDVAPRKNRGSDDPDEEVEEEDELSPFQLVPDHEHDSLVCMGLVTHTHIPFTTLYHETIRSEVYRMNALVSAINYTPDR